MKNIFALILAASMLLAGCSQKQAVSDQAFNDTAPVVNEQAVPATIAEESHEESAALEVVQAQVKVKRTIDKIFFDFDSYMLTPTSRKALQDKALWLQAQPEEVRIVIQGHTDERGSDKYNLVLGKKRAQVARDYLLTLGIAPERITIVSFGKEKTTRGAAGEIAWAKDRRAEFVMAN